jgi:hypothetical protein
MKAPEKWADSRALLDYGFTFKPVAFSADEIFRENYTVAGPEGSPVLVDLYADNFTALVLPVFTKEDVNLEYRVELGADGEVTEARVLFALKPGLEQWMPPALGELPLTVAPRPQEEAAAVAAQPPGAGLSDPAAAYGKTLAAILAVVGLFALALLAALFIPAPVLHPSSHRPMRR